MKAPGTRKTAVPIAGTAAVDFGAWALPVAPALKAGVAEQKPVPIQELPDGSDIAAAVKDGELGLCQTPYGVEDSLIPQILPALDQHGQVLGDEEGCVAVAVVVRVAGQLNDAVVCHADSAGGVQLAKRDKLRYNIWEQRIEVSTWTLVTNPFGKC